MEKPSTPKKGRAPAKSRSKEVLHVAGLQAAARRRGDRLTSVRKMVFLGLAASKKPISAYALLAFINKKKQGQKLSAASLYRVLDYLINLGFAIKIECTNSFALCKNAKNCRCHVMVVCDKCGTLNEVHDDKAFTSIQRIANAQKHALRNHAVEIHGLCEKCQ